MRILDDRSLPSGLFYFRVIVQIAIDEEIVELDDEGEAMEPLRGYFQTFGVTASSFADATARVEAILARHEPTGGDSDDPKGSVQMIEAAVLAPEEVEQEGSGWRTAPGLHFTSGRVFFTSDEAFEDEDPSGQQAIFQRVYDEIQNEEA